MIKLFEKSCEDIAREPFHGSVKCLVLAVPLIFLLAMFGFSILSNIVFFYLDQLTVSSALSSIAFCLSVVLYYVLIVAWSWVYRKAGFGYKSS